MKVCRQCARAFPVDHFYRRGDGPRRSECRACNTANQRAYRKANRARIRETSRARYAANPAPVKARALEYAKRNRDKILARARLRVTGWTREQFDAAWAKQRGLCAVCRVAMTRGKTVTGVTADHCHATGARRGLLCSRCNRGLGYFGDSPALLERAANYLEMYK